MLDFSQFGWPLNLGVFVAAAVAVWVAGTRIAGYADKISDATGIGHAMLGLILLAGVTSLPEIGVTLTSAIAGDAALAVNNLLGSIAMQIAILAVIDFFVVRNAALTSIIPEPAVMLQGALNILLLSIAAVGTVVGDVAFLGIGAWAWACLAGYACSVWLLSQAEGRRPWLAARAGRVDEALLGDENAHARKDESGRSDRALSGLIIRTVFAGTVILVAGYALSRTGSAIAEQTGIGSSFVGFVLVASSTSLPEFSTALASARLGLLTMAISDILGTNLINIGLIFVVDAMATGEPVFNRIGSFSTVGALLGIIVTTLFVAGMAERRDRTIWRMGIDSAAVVVFYVGGLVLLYSLRPSS